MSYTNYPIGSKWRKWDLHVHTPASIKQGYGNKEKKETWDLFVKALENLPEEVKVIGINDYYFIDGYEKIMMDYKFKGRLKNIEKIFPLLEFRIDTFGSGNENKLQKINLHILFDVNDEKKEKLEKDIERIKRQFIERITISGLDKHKTKYLSIENLIEEAGTLEKGFSNLIPSTNQVFEIIFSDTWKDKVFLFLGYKEWSNLEKNHQLRPFKEFLYNRVNAFFTSNIDTYEKSQKWLNEFGNKRLLHSLDIHDFDKLENNYNCFTWIKADPTFEGLRQIIYEPEDRVRIQEEKPEQKTDYLVIDAVRFLDNRKNPEFSNKWICLNPNLNSIIGGKSSGKSLLLYHIAKTIDPERIDEINKDKEYRRLEYNFEKDPKFDFEVKWSDGETYRLKDSEKKRVRSITYIPQLYLNRLAEEKKDELNQLVDNILLESSLEYKNFRDEQKKKIYEIKEKISTDINKFYEFSEEIKRKEKEKKDIGDKKAIQSNKEKIEKEIENIRANSKFSKEEQEKYKKLFEERTKIKKKILNLEEIIKILNIAKKEIENYNSSFKEKFNLNIVDRVKEQYPTATDDSLKILLTILNSISEKVMAILKQSLEDKFVIIEEKIKELRKLRKEEESLIDELKQFEDKIKNKKRFVELKKQEEEENNKVKKIIDLETEIEKLKERRNNLKNSFLENYTNLFKCYQTIVLKNEKHRSISQQDNLELISDIAIKNEKFEKNFLGKIDKRKSLKDQFGNYFSDKGKYLFEPDKHLDNIKDMVEKIIEKKIELNKGFEEKHVINALLDDYFYIDYDIVKEGDKLVNMSPGKMGIILFQLYLHLSKSKNPILIDQPEDNLDNRTVYAELNDFIRKKKIERQIIIVSHNANLVVSTDSENVIVANQSGQETSKDNKKYRFEYVNGSLEHTFYDESQSGILYKKGIREHVCEILEGGKDAFKKRENKYGFKT